MGQRATPTSIRKNHIVNVTHRARCADGGGGRERGRSSRSIPPLESAGVEKSKILSPSDMELFAKILLILGITRRLTKDEWTFQECSASMKSLQHFSAKRHTRFRIIYEGPGVFVQLDNPEEYWSLCESHGTN